MESSNDLPDMRYDFSYLSKNRLRAFNMMMSEFDRMNSKEDILESELSDDVLDMLAAAGTQDKKPSGLLD